MSDAAWAAFAAEETLAITYDSAGRRVKEALGAGATTFAVHQLAYDSTGRLLCVAQRMNPDVFASLPASACTPGVAGTYGPDRIEKRVHDAAGQLIQTISGLGITGLEQTTATMAYTANGKLSTLTDARGHVTTFLYDGFDRLVERRYPDATNGSFSSTVDVETFAYDANGAVTQIVTRDGRAIGLQYDALGRLVFRDLPGAAARRRFVYDRLGRLVEVSLTSGETVTIVHDRLSRVLSVVAVGVQATIIGSTITAASGFALFALGDRRTGAKAILDGLGGRALKRIPDEFAPVSTRTLDELENRVINFFDERGADIRDCIK